MANWFPLPGKKPLITLARRLREIRDSKGGQQIGVIGSNRTTNEENYLLQKFARVVLGTNNIDHHRTADYSAFARAMAGKQNATATMRDVSSAPAILLIGNDPTEQHPLLAWNIRTNVRLNRAKLYVVNSQADQAAATGDKLCPDRRRQRRQICGVPEWRRRGCGFADQRIGDQ